jgi:hypothetical protein
LSQIARAVFLGALNACTTAGFNGVEFISEQPDEIGEGAKGMLPTHCRIWRKVWFLLGVKNPITPDGPDGLDGSDWMEGLGSDGCRRVRRVRRVGWWFYSRRSCASTIAVSWPFS